MYVGLVKLINALGLYPFARSLRIWFEQYTRSRGYGIRRHQNLIKFYSQFMCKGNLCFDIGANVGDRAGLFLELGCKVVCVEPQNDCAEVLRERFRNSEKLIVVQKVLGESEGRAELYVCEYNPGISTLSKKWMRESRYGRKNEWKQINLVDVTTLDKLIEIFGLPKFCKIDVEGFEEHVLKGLTKPIPYLSFEFSRELLEDVKKCLDRILFIGPAVFNCTICDSVEMLSPYWISADDLYERLESLDKPDTWGDVYVRFEEEIRKT